MQMWIFLKISNVKVYIFQVNWILCCFPHPGMISVAL